jgi:RNA polymerase-binding transcription factor DksA
VVLESKRHSANAASANAPTGALKPSHVRELLLTLKTRLEAQLNGNGAPDATSSTGMAGMVGITDMADTAADVHETVVERAVQGIITRQLEQIKDTLMRIDDGKYGTCAHCHKPIAADRLVVRPFSTLCMECQNQLDRGTRARL